MIHSSKLYYFHKRLNCVGKVFEWQTFEYELRFTIAYAIGWLEELLEEFFELDEIHFTLIL